MLAAAGSQAAKKQVIVVVDREGVILGTFRLGRVYDASVSNRSLDKAVARARTAAPGSRM